MNARAVGQIKIVELRVLIRSGHVETAYIALVRKEFDPAIVDSLSLQTNYGFALGNFCTCDSGIHDVDDAANSAVGIEQRSGTFHHLYLTYAKEIYIHAVVSAQSRNVSGPDAVV